MLKNKLLLILALVLSGCTQQGPGLLISSLQNKPSDSSALLRKLASQPNNLCLQDIFTVETLKLEVKEAERGMPADPVEGSWRHLDLSTLSSPAANFLKTYGAMIGDLENDSIDYSSCEDIPCIFNQIYGKGDQVAGYVHYLWYLRFGHMLSADNKAPFQKSPLPGTYNGKNFPLASYLYNEQELYALWRLSLMLNSPHTTLGMLKEIQRMPRGQKFEPPFSASCGIANSGGYIILTDGCVEAKDDGGYLYAALTHELSHMVDFEEGSVRYGESYRSHQKDYLDIIGYKLEEFRDTLGNVQRNWRIKDKTTLITDYSAGNPQENFAELLAYFRVDGDKVKQKATAAHFNFASDNFYHQREFTKQSFLDEWSKKEVGDTQQTTLKQVLGCLKQDSISLCLKNESLNLSAEITARTKIKYPEACGVLNDSTMRAQWQKQLTAKIQASHQRFMLLNHNPEALALLQENFEGIFASKLAYASYLACADGDQPCYLKQVRMGSTIIKDLPISKEQQESLIESYLASYPYSSVRQEVKKFYSLLVSSHQGIIRKKVSELWEKCSERISDLEAPKAGPFVVADGYMVSSVYNCINRDVETLLASSMRNLKNLEQEKSYVSGLMKAKILESLKDKYIAVRESEKKNALYFAEVQRAPIKSMLLTNRYWTKRNQDPAVLKGLCAETTYKIIGMKVICHLKSELYKDFVENQICAKVISEL